MSKIAILGPAGTYTSKAVELLKNEYEPVYYPSILKSLMAVDEEVDALIPFENTLDGFVYEGVDAIIKNGLHIVEEVKLEVGFNCISNCDIKDVEVLYVQFKAYGQCLDFISKHDLKIITTESNIESLNWFLKNPNKSAAIIPNHLNCSEYKEVIYNIADSRNNETRFVRVAKNPKYVIEQHMVASMVITPIADKAGLLYDLLKHFKDYDFNLRTIMSRPRRDEIGKYSFYIELDLESNKLELLYELAKMIENVNANSSIIGIYNKI